MNLVTGGVLMPAALTGLPWLVLAAASVAALVLFASWLALVVAAKVQIGRAIMMDPR